MAILTIAVAFFLLSVCTSQNQDSCPITPRNFETNFRRGCNNVKRSLNCDNVWEAFRDAFAGKEPEAVIASDYQPYFDKVPFNLPSHQTLFWTRTEGLVEILSKNTKGVSVKSSFNTDSSKIINGIKPGKLNWCGNRNGIDFESPNCLCNVTTRFWFQYSSQLAKASKGIVFYLTDGEDSDGAFRSNSFFATAEVPSLRNGIVTRMVALVVHRKGINESCAEGKTIKELEDVIVKRSLDFDCYDIYAQAKNSATAESTAKCIRKVIGNVQKNRETSVRQIECNGASAMRASFIGLLVGAIAVTLMK